MLHLSLLPRELDEQYPSMRAPADDRMEDYLKDYNDMVSKHGMEVCAYGPTRPRPLAYAIAKASGNFVT